MTAPDSPGQDVPPPPDPKCLHCRVRPPSKRRGLCCACYAAPSVRERYPRKLNSQTKLLAGEDGEAAPPLSDHPTAALPGTRDKVGLMAERLAAGRAIFHPGDLRYDEEHPMPRDLAERMRAREAKEQQELKRRRARLKAAKRSKEEQARREAEADAAVPWRAYRCCLFGAVLRGQCPCSSPRLKLPRGRRPRRTARRAVPGPVLYDPADGSPALAGAG